MQEQSSAGRQRGAAGERTGGINTSLCSPAVPLAPDSHPGRDDVGDLHLLPLPGRPARVRAEPVSSQLFPTPATPGHPTTSQLRVSGRSQGAKGWPETHRWDAVGCAGAAGVGRRTCGKLERGRARIFAL